MTTDQNSKEDQTQTANDYRGQMQARFGVKRKSLVEDFQERSFEVIAHLKRAFPRISEIDIESIFEKAVTETSSDDGIAHAYFLSRKVLVEKAASDLGYDLSGGISAGYLSSYGVEAMQQRVMMTSASVVLVSDSLGLLGIWLSKLLARSIPFDLTDGGFRLKSDIEATKQRLLQDPDLQAHWTWFFYMHARCPNSEIRGPVLISQTEEEITLWSEISEAIDLFVLSHEYGHHIADHRVGDQLSVDGEEFIEAHRKELEADQIAADLCCKAGADLDEPNFFAMSNTGSACILYSLELIRRGRRILETGVDTDSSTRASHPPLKYRLMVIEETVKRDFPHISPGLLAMQELFVNTLSYVWTHVSVDLINRHNLGDRSEEETSGWLPR